MKRRVLLLTPLLLACGPYFYPAPQPLQRYPTRIAGKGWLQLLQEARPLAADYATTDELTASCQILAGEFDTLSEAQRLERIDALILRNREGKFGPKTANLLLEMRELAATPASQISAIKDYLVWRAGAAPQSWEDLAQTPTQEWDWAWQQKFQASHDQSIHDYGVHRSMILTQLGERTARSPEILVPNHLVQQAAALFDERKFEEAAAAFTGVVTRFPDHPRAEVATFMIARCLHQQARHKSTVPLTEAEITALRQSAEAGYRTYLEKYPTGRFVPDVHGWLGGLAVDRGDESAALAHQLERLTLRPTRETLRSVLRESDLIFNRIFQQFSYAAPSRALPDEWQGEAEAKERQRVAQEIADLRVETLPYDALAQHPEVARLLINYTLDPLTRDRIDDDLDSESGGAWLVNSLHDRIILPQPFAHRVLEELGHAFLRAGEESRPADPTSQLILGWSALKDGRPEDALPFFDQGMQKSISAQRRDDVMLGRAMTLTALGRHGEAAATYGEILQLSPISPLSSAISLEMDISLVRAGRAGDIYLNGEPTGKAQADPTKAAVATDLPDPHSWRENHQWSDTFSQFASPSELAMPLQQWEPLSPESISLRAVVRTRYLAAGNFNEAAKYIDPPELVTALYRNAFNTSNDYDFYGRRNPADNLLMTQKRWDAEVAPLRRAVEAAESAPGDASAALAAGRAWQAARGLVTQPLQEVEGFCGSEPEKLDQLRRMNAATLGLSPDQITRELDSRDELNHALKYYLAAAAAKPSAITPAALEAANEVLPRLAEFSLYALDRAVEQDHTALSAKIVARLKKEFPKSKEAARAVAWTFRPLGQEERWMPGDYTPSNSADALLDALYYPGPPLSPTGSNYWGRRGEAPPHGIFQVPNQFTSQDMEGIRAEIAALMKSFQAQREQLSVESILDTSARLGDLTDAAAVPGMTVEVFRRYSTDSPYSEEEHALLEPVHAYRDTFAANRINRSFGATYPEVAIAWDAYLSAHPGGPKEEAALLQLVRARVYEVSPIPQIRAFHYPEAPIPGGYKRLAFFPRWNELVDNLDEYPPDRRQVDQLKSDGNQLAQRYQWLFMSNLPISLQQIPPDTREGLLSELTRLDREGLEQTKQVEAREQGEYEEAAKARRIQTPIVIQELKDYEARYPHGRYLADIRLLRSSLWADRGNYTTAINDLTGIIEDPGHAELHMDAALRFAEISLRMLDPAQRPGIAAAFRANPAALRRLRNLATSDTCLFRLRPLLPWLESPPH